MAELHRETTKGHSVLSRLTLLVSEFGPKVKRFYIPLKMGGEQRAPFSVAVIGGGIGGLFAALSLHYHCADQGIEIDVYEQAFEYKEIGAGVGIGVNAARLLHRLGLGDAANEIAGYRNGVWISFRRSDTGEEIVTVPVNDKEKIRQLPMHRADFLDLLLGAVRERKAARLHTNKRCKRLIVSRVMFYYRE